MINGTLPGFPKQGPGTRDSDQWFTPTAVVEAARAAMGGIDLDPASCAEAQARVRAARWIGAPDDGLAAAWSGRIWLNPPYSDPRPWAEKLAAGWRSGRVAAGIILIHATAALGSAYGLRLMDEASLAVFPGRIRFVRPGGSPGDAPRDASVLIAGGPAIDAAHAGDALSAVGAVYGLAAIRRRPGAAD